MPYFWVYSMLVLHSEHWFSAWRISDWGCGMAQLHSLLGLPGSSIFAWNSRSSQRNEQHWSFWVRSQPQILNHIADHHLQNLGGRRRKPPRIPAVSFSRKPTLKSAVNYSVTFVWQFTASCSYSVTTVRFEFMKYSNYLEEAIVV